MGCKICWPDWIWRITPTSAGWQQAKKQTSPRFQGRHRDHSFTYKEYGNGAQPDNGYLVLSKIGRIAVRWSRPMAGTIKTVPVSRGAAGW
jgi:hypothetical protein